MGPAEIVRRFYAAMQARDWDAAVGMLSPDIRITYTETGEVFDGANFLAMNRAYPAGWNIEVVEVIESGSRAAAQVRVTLGDEAFWCAGFYEVDEHRITSGTEHWVTEHSEQPPEWRERFTTT